MKQIIQNMKTGETQVIDVPIPVIQPGYLLIQTIASLVSSGTERTLVSFAEKNLVGKAQSRPDLMKQVLEKAKREGFFPTINAAFNRLDQPLTLGYSSAGKVVEVGTGLTEFSPGDRVVCAGGGYAVHAEYALVPKNLVARLPDTVDFESGAFATLGAIALNGVRLSSPQVGESCAVIGLGLLGLLTSQILMASGCEVIGMDINTDRVNFAEKTGMQAFSNEFVHGNYASLTKGRGFDHIFICADTSSDEPIEVAGEIARDRANVIAIGAVGLDIPRKLYYEKELTFKVARSYGPGRYDHTYEEDGADYPLGYVRWTEGRNLEAIVGLLSRREMNVTPLITHHFPISNAQDAYALITGEQTTNYLGVIITYPNQEDQQKKESIVSFSNSHALIVDGKLNVGVIGAGNYANAVFLPALKNNPNIILNGIVSVKGLNAQHSARKFGFSFAGSSEESILNNKDIDLVAILTQHDDHARLVKDCLHSGKHVFCEKPLALNKEQLITIIPELQKKVHPYLTVGFNRRFASFSKHLKSFFSNRTEPMYANYRVNAGFIPTSHWLHDPLKGGGRLIGEGCHFIDYLIFLFGQTPESVQTRSLPNLGKYTNDNFLITLMFPDGSIGTITYLSNGNKALGKEYLEVFCEGKTGILDDFRKLQLFGKSIDKKRALFTQDKGHTASLNAFVKTITQKGEPPISYSELISTAYVTLGCDQSLRTGQPVNIEEFIQAN
ncbi:MAG: bi-domain-containing oxidoreductase [Pelolinea sp.]|nr:bi-domain-containing oxidoreductase [Pelolinea sp.]